MTQSDTPPETQKPRRNWMRLALILSLALNLLVVGLVVGAMARHGGPKGGGDFAGSYVFVRALDRDSRAEFREKTRSTFRRPGGTRKEYREASQAVKAAVLAVPFSRDALLEALRAQSSIRARFDEAFYTGLADTLAGMTDAERAAYVERVQELSKRRGGRENRK